MLSLDMLYKEVSYILTKYEKLIYSDFVSDGSYLPDCFSVSTGSKGFGQCCGDHADPPLENSEEKHTGLFAAAEVCCLIDIVY